MLKKFFKKSHIITLILLSIFFISILSSCSNSKAICYGQKHNKFYKSLKRSKNKDFIPKSYKYKKPLKKRYVLVGAKKYK